MKNILVVALTALLAACGGGREGSQPAEMSDPASVRLPPPLKPGQVLDPESLYAKRWRDRPTPIRLNGELGFAVPPGYQPFWFDNETDVVDTPKTWEEIPVGVLTFRFFIPDFRGYTPDNYLREFDEDRVDVISIQWVGLGQERPGAPGGYPPNMLSRLLKGVSVAGPFKRYGLDCYRREAVNEDNSPNKEFCIGPQSDDRYPQVFIDATMPPYADWIKFPTIQATYFTPRHGGLEVLWRAHAKHLANWQIIDQQVWKFFEAWRVERPADGIVRMGSGPSVVVPAAERPTGRAE
jgi:hypothetical protein